MTNIPTKPDESQLHLEALLYLLGDPALDRQAFEVRLADDSRLGEILSEAVSVYQWTQGVSTWRMLPASDPTLTAQATMALSSSVWRTYATLAASFLLVGFFGWQAIPWMRSTSAEIALLNNVVSAWGELQKDELDSQFLRDSIGSDFENAIASQDLTFESDVPEWLVLAAADRLDGDELSDGKAFIQ